MMIIGLAKADQATSNRAVIIFILFDKITRGLWTAMPALIKVKETGQIFTWKKYSRIVQFYRKSKMCVHSFSFLAQKALFLPPL